MASAPTVSDGPDDTRRVLVVDDSEDQRLILSLRLRQKGWHVDTAQDGPAALDHLATHTPDVILCDYMMPGMSGPELVASLQDDPRLGSIPIVMLTASEAPEHIDAALEAGAHDYLVRPVGFPVLCKKLEVATRVRRAPPTPKEPAPDLHLLKEMEQAKEVQQKQLPRLPASWRGWRTTGAVSPSGHVGGDLIAHFATSVDDACVALIDVSGHGLAAALVAQMVVAELQACTLGRSLPAAVARLNRRLVDRDVGHYVCLAVLRTQGDRVHVLNAGLPPVAHIRDGRVLAHLHADGVPPGLLGDQSYGAHALDVEPGDRLVVLSDGLTEPFGEADDVDPALARLDLLGAEVPTLFEERGAHARLAAIFSEPQPDDATLLVLEHVGLPGRARRVFDADLRAIQEQVAWVLEQLPENVDRDLVGVGVTEAVTNAVMHGVLESGEGRAGLERQEAYLRLSRQLVEDAIALSVRRKGRRCVIGVAWTGNPCPPEKRGVATPAARDPLAESGRGLALIDAIFDRVEWREDGRAMDLVLEGD